MGKQADSVEFKAKIMLSGEEGAWKAFVAPPGVVVHGKTRDEIAARASRAIDGMMVAFSERADFPSGLYAYLDAREVEYTVKPSAADVAEAYEELLVPRKELVLA